MLPQEALGLKKMQPLGTKSLSLFVILIKNSGKEIDY